MAKPIASYDEWCKQVKQRGLVTKKDHDLVTCVWAVPARLKNWHKAGATWEEVAVGSYVEGIGGIFHN